MAIQIEKYKDCQITVIDNQIGKYRNSSIISSPKIDTVFESSNEIVFNWSPKFNQQSLILEIFTKDKNSSQTILLPNDSTQLKISLKPDLYYWYLLSDEGEQLELGRVYVKE